MPANPHFDDFSCSYIANRFEILDHNWLPECVGENVVVLPVEYCNHMEKYVYTKIKISTSMVDINDYASYTLTLVLNGTAVMYSCPSVPYFQRKRHAELLNMEASKCKRTKDKTATEMKSLGKDPARLIRSILIVFPKGMVCTTDFDTLEPSIPTGDKKVKRLMRHINTSDSIGKKNPEQVAQHFRPIHWNLRVISEGDDALVDDEESSDDDLCDGLEGMNLTSDAMDDGDVDGGDDDE